MAVCAQAVRMLHKQSRYPISDVLTIIHVYAICPNLAGLALRHGVPSWRRYPDAKNSAWKHVRHRANNGGTCAVAQADRMKAAVAAFILIQTHAYRCSKAKRRVF